MAIQNRQWITIEECIYQYLNESEQSNNKYAKLWHIAYRGMEEMGLDAFYAIKTVKIPVNANLTVNLPSDYVQYSKIGVLNSKGEIIPLSLNNNLTTAFDFNPTRLAQTEDDTLLNQATRDGVWWYNYWNGNSFGPVYGLPSGSPFVGSFRVDSATNLIVLGSNFIYDYIMLEYLSSPNPAGEYYIPVQFREALITYLGWKDLRFVPSKSHVQNSNVSMRRSDFYNELEKAKARYDPVRIPDIYDWWLQNQRLVVKG